MQTLTTSSSPTSLADSPFLHHQRYDRGILLSGHKAEQIYLTPPMSRPTTPKQDVSEAYRESIDNAITTTSTTSKAPPGTDSSDVALASVSRSLQTQIASPAQTSSTSISALAQKRPALSITTNSGGPPESAVSADPIEASLPTVSSSTRGTRKSKAHVPSACINCKRAHLSCEVQRPCRRCIDAGKEDTCVDVQHKKRGRPRLRESTDAGSIPAQAGPSQSSMNRPIASTRSRRAESFRSHQSQGSEGSSYGPHTPVSTRIGTGTVPPAYFVPPVTPVTQEIPTAFLDLDLVIIRANRAFHRALGSLNDLSRVRLADIMVPADGEAFTNIRNQLRDEREQREPSFLPPILPSGHNILDNINDTDVDNLTRGFVDRTYTWLPTIHRASSRTVTARVRLAKISTYFAVVTLPTSLDAPPIFGSIAGYNAPLTTPAQPHPGYTMLPPYSYTAPTMLQSPPQAFVPNRSTEAHQSQPWPVASQQSQLQEQYSTQPQPYAAAMLPRPAAESQMTSPTRRQPVATATAVSSTSLHHQPATDETTGAGSLSRTPRKRRRLGIDEVLQ